MKGSGLVIYEEEYVLNSRGMKLFTCRWIPSKTPKALVFLCHGYAMECSDSMKETGLRLAISGYEVYGIDYEGHGRSQGLKGYVPCFGNLVQDCSTFFGEICERSDKRHVKKFLLGESMGGAVAISIHRLQPNNWDGAVLIAPMCKISEELKPHPMVITVLSKLICFVPTWKIVPTRDIFEVGYQDPEKRRTVKESPLIYHDKARLRTACELLTASIKVEEQLEEVSIAMLIAHGEEDKVTDPSVSKLLYERAQSADKTLKIYPNMWHGLLCGETPLNTEIVFSDVIAWLDKRSLVTKK